MEIIEYHVSIKSPNPERIESMADDIAELANLSYIKEYHNYKTEIKGYKARHHLFPNVDSTGEMSFESTWDVRDTIYKGPNLDRKEHIIFSCVPKENPKDRFSVELLKGAYIIRSDRGEFEFSNQLYA